MSEVQARDGDDAERSDAERRESARIDEREAARRTDRPQPATPVARRRRRWVGHIVWTGILLGLVAATAWTFMPGGQVGDGTRRQPQGRFRPQEVTPVGAVTAKTADLPVYLDALGTVTPLATATIKTRVAGQIMRLAFTEGQDVKMGDVIAEIDDRSYRFTLDQARGTLMRDQALLKNAQLDLARYQKLVSQDSLARQQLDTQQALVQQYEGVVKTDQANVETAELNLSYTKVTAPIDGTLGLKQVDIGSYVTPSDTTGIVVVTQFKPISVVFSVPEDDLSRIRARLAAGETPEVVAYDRGRRNELARGKLTSIDNQIDTSTGTVKLRATFENPGRTLFPNQFVNIRLTVETLRNALQLPATAIQRGQQGTFVFRVEADNTVSLRPVKVGAASLDQVTVLEGLAAGDIVVTDGTDKLRAGTLVSTTGLKEVTVPLQGGERPRGAGGQGDQRGQRPAGGASGGTGGPGGPGGPGGGPGGAGGGPGGPGGPPP
jgi:multidrug efflux system membrane fusion protein